MIYINNIYIYKTVDKKKVEKNTMLYKNNK